MRSRAIREGSLGLLIIVGLGCLGGLILWLRGFQFGNKNFTTVIEFNSASGLQVGSPVRYRGVNIGKVMEIQPGPNGVDVKIQIIPEDLIIPRNVNIESNQSGFIGAASVDLTPTSEIQTSAITAKPLEPNCPGNLIICHNSRLQGRQGVTMEDFIKVGVKMADAYTDPELFESIKSVADNTAAASREATKLTRDLSDLTVTVKAELQGMSSYIRDDVGGLTQTMRTEMGGVSQTLKGEIGGLSQTLKGEIGGLSQSLKGEIGGLTTTLEREIEVVSDELVNVSNTTQSSAKEVSAAAIASANSVKEAADRITITANEINSLLDTNRSTIVATLDNISKTTQELRIAVDNLSPIINEVERGNFLENLETVSENAAEASTNLRNISRQLNDPANVSQLTETLESAQTTLQNMEKITQDVDDFTGDPLFRDNLKKLINGLGQLFSSTQELEAETQMARNLEMLLEKINSAEESQ